MNLGKTLGEALLAPTRIYVKAYEEILRMQELKLRDAAILQVAVSMKIFLECLPDGVKAVVKEGQLRSSCQFLTLLAEDGDIAEEMMYNTFQYGYWHGTGS